MPPMPPAQETDIIGLHYLCSVLFARAPVLRLCFFVSGNLLTH